MDIEHEVLGEGQMAPELRATKSLRMRGFKGMVGGFFSTSQLVRGSPNKGKKADRLRD